MGLEGVLRGGGDIWCRPMQHRHKLGAYSIVALQALPTHTSPGLQRYTLRLLHMGDTYEGDKSHRRDRTARSTKMRSGTVPLNGLQVGVEHLVTLGVPPLQQAFWYVYRSDYRHTVDISVACCGLQWPVMCSGLFNCRIHCTAPC